MNCVFPHPVGPAIIAVNGCFQTNDMSLNNTFLECALLLYIYYFSINKKLMFSIIINTFYSVILHDHRIIDFPLSHVNNCICFSVLEI